MEEQHIIISQPEAVDVVSLWNDDLAICILYLFYITVFYFHLFDKQWNQFSTACGPPEEGFAECCFEEEPLFYMITIIDQQGDEEMVRQN